MQCIDLKRDENLLKQLSLQILLPRKDKLISFISICGAAATGKSTLAKILAKYVQDHQKNVSIDILPLDSFMLDRGERRSAKLSGYDPRAHSVEKAVECIESLQQNNLVYYKPYSHLSGHRGKKNKVLKPSDIIILEGIHSFHEAIIRKIDLAIFIDGDKEVLKTLRFNADVKERKYSPLTAFRHSELEYNNFEKFILPYKKYADIILNVQPDWQYIIQL